MQFTTKIALLEPYLGVKVREVSKPAARAERICGKRVCLRFAHTGWLGARRCRSRWGLFALFWWQRWGGTSGAPWRRTVPRGRVQNRKRVATKRIFFRLKKKKVFIMILYSLPARGCFFNLFHLPLRA